MRYLIPIVLCILVFGWVISTANCPADKVPVRGIIAFECVSR